MEEDARVLRVSEECDGLRELDAHDEYQRNRTERLDRAEGYQNVREYILSRDKKRRKP